MSETTDRMIAALLRERDGYLRAGRPERAKAVDEQLALRGHVVAPATVDEPPAGDSSGEQGDADAPRQRQSRPRQQSS